MCRGLLEAGLVPHASAITASYLHVCAVAGGAVVVNERISLW